MKPPEQPANEAARLLALEALHVLDTPPEKPFDDLTRLAAHILEVPIALVSLVDAKRQWFKSRFGLDAPETSRDVSFCGHAVADGRLLVVADAFEDARFSDNPIVTGEPRVRFYAGAPLITRQGEALGTLCVIDHVARSLDAERLEMLEALARQVMSQLELRRELIDRQRLSAIIEATPDFVGIAELTGRVVYLNPAARRTLGLAPDEALPASGAVVYPPGVRDHIERQAIPAALREGAWLGETAILAADGREVPVLQLILAQRDQEGRIGFLATHARDISDRKKVEELKGQFVSMVSHELRTPLTSILGSLRLIEGGATSEASEETLELVGVARRNSERLLRLINDILDLEKVEADELELRLANVLPRDVVAQALTGLASVAQEAGVSIRDEVGELPAMRADPERIVQVLMNLIGNAIKFSAPGAGVGVGGEMRAGRVRLWVADEGPGIPERDLPLLFGRFQQLDSSDARAKGGTGLGLAISKAIVERLGGSIGADSRLGEGTTFWFEIPAAS